jgi:chromosome segregation ATPase
MNSFAQTGLLDPLRTLLETQAKQQEDPFYNIPLTAFPNMASTDYFTQLAKENESLRISNAELQARINELTARVAELKTSPIRMENSPEQTARIMRLETEKERLLAQLRDKTEQFEELKLKTRDFTDKGRMENTIENIRKEIQAQLKEEYETKARKHETSMDLLHKDLEEAQHLLASKTKEVEMLEQNITGMERRTLEDLENMRRNLTQTLWDEYEKKLNAKKEEFDDRCRNNMAEIDRLAGLVKDWRSKCIELEEKNSSMYSKMNNANDRDLDLKRVVAGYEDRILHLERELEKYQQLNSDNNSSNSISRERVRFLEKALTDLEEKKLEFDHQLMEKEAQTKAALKELDKAKADNQVWKNHLEKAENELSKAKLRIIDLENSLKSTANQSHGSNQELVFEKATKERMNADLLSTQAELKSAIAGKDFLEQQLKKAREDGALKNELIEEYKRINAGLKSGYEGLAHEHATLKAQTSRDQDQMKFLSTQIDKIYMERQELAAKTEAEKLKQGRPERSALSMLNRQREGGDTEIRILKDKLEESESQLKAVRIKLGQLSQKSAEIIQDGQTLINENKDLNSRNSLLQKQIELLKQELAEQKLNSQKLEIDRGSAFNELQMAKKLNDVLSNTQKEGEANQARTRALEEEITNLRGKIDEQQREYNRLKDDLNSKERAIIQLDPKPVNEKLDSMFKEKEASIAKLNEAQGEIKKQSAAIQTAQVENSNLASRNKELETELARLRTEITEVKNEKKLKLDELIKLREDAAGAISRLKAENDGYVREIQNLTNVMEKLEKTPARVAEITKPQEEAISRLRSENESNQKEIQSLKLNIERLITSQNSQKTSDPKTQAQLEELVTRLKAENEANLREIQSLKVHIQSLESIPAKVADTLRPQEQAIGRLRGENEGLHKEMLILRANNERLEKALQAASQSHQQLQVQLQTQATQLSQAQAAAAPKQDSAMSELQAKLASIQNENIELQAYVKQLINSQQILANQAREATVKLEVLQQQVKTPQQQTPVQAPSPQPQSGQNDEKLKELGLIVSELQQELEYKDKVIKRNEETMRLQAGDLGKENQQMAIDIEYLKSLADRLAHENELFLGQNNSLKDANKAILEEVELLRSDNISLTDQIQQMRRSNTQQGQTTGLQLKPQENKSQSLMAENQRLMAEVQNLIMNNSTLLEQNHELEKNVLFN